MAMSGLEMIINERGRGSTMTFHSPEISQHILGTLTKGIKREVTDQHLPLGTGIEVGSRCAGAFHVTATASPTPLCPNPTSVFPDTCMK